MKVDNLSKKNLELVKKIQIVFSPQKCKEFKEVFTREFSNFLAFSCTIVRKIFPSCGARFELCLPRSSNPNLDPGYCWPFFCWFLFMFSIYLWLWKTRDILFIMTLSVSWRQGIFLIPEKRMKFLIPWMVQVFSGTHKQ